MRKFQLLASVCAVVASVASAADVSWTGQAGDGKWSTGENWSSGTVPTSEDDVNLAAIGEDYEITVDSDTTIGNLFVGSLKGDLVQTVTLSGSAKITTLSNSTRSPHVQERRCLVLNGVSVDVGNAKNLQLYGSLMLKTGSVVLINRHCQMYGDGAQIIVDGGTFNDKGFLSYYTNSKVTVNSGEFFVTNASGVYPNQEGKGFSITFVVNGGTVSTRGIRLEAGGSLTVNDGSMTVVGSKVSYSGAAGTEVKSLVMTADSSLTVTGGRLELTSALPEVAPGARRVLTGGEIMMTNLELNGRDWLEATAGTTLGAKTIRPMAADESDVMCTVRGPLKATSSLTMCGTNNMIVGTCELSTGVLFNETGAKNTVSFPKIVYTGGVNWAKTDDGNNRDVILDGPTEIRARQNMQQQNSKNVYGRATGDFTVDTRDPDDPAVQRLVYLDGFGTLGGTTLTVQGGGKCVVKQAYSQNAFTRVSVGSGTTLSLMPTTLSSDAGYLRAEKFELGPDAELEIPTCGSNGVFATKWSIDPTARISVTVQPGFTGGAIPVLVDVGGGLPAGIVSQTTVNGLPAGASLEMVGGSLYVIKAKAAAADGTYEYEWTGAGEDRNFSTATNWYANAEPPEKLPYVFGAADTYLNPYFDNVYSSPGVKGSTLGQVLFRDTAVRTFTIDGKSTITLSYNGIPSSKTTTTVSVLSQSAAPQVIDRPLRSTASLSLFAATPLGSLTVNGAFTITRPEYKMYVYGDVRTGGNVQKKVPELAFIDDGARSMGTALTVLPGSSMTFTNHTLNLSASNARFLVHEGATLTFEGVDTSHYYRWVKRSAVHVVNGTMNISEPFIGGYDQTYGGSGTLNLARLDVFAAPTCLKFADTLTVNLAKNWNTTASNRAGASLQLCATGQTTLNVPTAWTYGPDVADTPIPAKSRALLLQANGVLTLNANGGVATVDERVTGRGTLAMANGTLRLNAASESEFVGVSIASGSGLEINAAQTLGSVSLASGTTADIKADVSLRSLTAGGATLKIASGVKLTAPEGLDVDGVTFDLPDSALAATGWQTLVSSTGTIAGTPVLAQGWKSRVITEAGVAMFQVKPERGLLLMVR